MIIRTTSRSNVAISVARCKTVYRILLVAAFWIGSICLLAQPLTGDRKQSFDHNWKFSLGEIVGASARDFNDTVWRDVTLPHDWSIEGTINVNNPTGNDGGYFPAGVGWYRKTFFVPSKLQDKILSIYFEGVYMNAEVFINGVSVGSHPYGYTSFSCDLTPHLKMDEQNVIAVRVDNSKQKNCRWYSGSGIYRHVYLIATDPVHIEHWGVSVTTPTVTKAEAVVNVRTILKNETESPQTVVVSSAVLMGKNSTTAKNVEVLVPAKSSQEIVDKVSIISPALWSPENPALYDAVVTVSKNGKVIDQTTAPFGIRSIAFSTNKGFLLNGEKVILNGGCVHHDNGGLGAAAYDKAEVRRVKLLKNAGFNAVRTSHNPPSEAFLHACDSIGLLVIDEAFDGWKESKTPHDYSTLFDQWWKRDIDAMVLRDRNHPAIIMWSIGNEIIERKKPEAIETAKTLGNRVRQLDPTRPVTSAMTTWDQEWEMFDSLFAAHDVAGYNYQLHRAASDHQRVPSRIIVQTESYPRDAFANWKLVQNNAYIIGDFVWTAMDYLGESGIGRYYYPGEPDGQHWEKNFFPWHGAYCGDIDLTGWRKPISHYRDMLYNGREKLYMAVKEPNPSSGGIKETMWSVWPTWESWTWPGFEGKNIEVEIYSNYPKVALYLNDQLIGEKSTTVNEEFKAIFVVPYSAGVLQAVGRDGNKNVESVFIRTANMQSKIILKADSKTLKGDAQDLCFVEVNITDETGVLDPNANNLLSFKVTGPAVIAAVDNADLKDPSAYVAAERKAWRGRALVVLKSTMESGQVLLEVSGKGLKPASILLKSSK